MIHKRDKLTPADIAIILQLRKDGITYSEIGRRFGVHHTTILYFCKRGGMVMSIPTTKHPKGIKKFRGKKELLYNDYVKKQANIKIVRDSSGKAIQVTHDLERKNECGMICKI